MVYVLNKNVNIILSDFIPNETVSCYDKDQPQINSKINNFFEKRTVLIRITLKKIKVMNHLQHYK